MKSLNNQTLPFITHSTNTVTNINIHMQHSDNNNDVTKTNISSYEIIQQKAVD